MVPRVPHHHHHHPLVIPTHDPSLSQSIPVSNMSTVRTADPHAYLKWPRLIMFNLNGALSIAATGVSARCTPSFLPRVFLMIPER